MKKLYKTVEGKTHYAEAWTHDGKCTFHWGVVGDRGESTESKVPNGTADESAIDLVLKDARSDGFAEIPATDHYSLVVTYKTEHKWGDTDDLDRRHAAEELINECLGWTGNGHCDGGDIGSGEMAIFSYVVDPEAAGKAIAQELVDYEQIEGATITSRLGEGDQKVLWTPEDGAKAIAEMKAEWAAEEQADAEAAMPPETESEWAASGNPVSLRSAIPKAKLTERRCRLYAIACCNRIKEHAIHPDSLLAIEFATQLANGTADKKYLATIAGGASDVLGNTSMMDLLEEGDFDMIEEMEGDVEAIKQMCELAKPLDVDSMVFAHAADAILNTLSEDPLECFNSEMTAAWAAAEDKSDRTEESEQKIQSEFIRDIFGNPFSPPALDAVWRSEEVKSLATKMDQSNDFSDMPNLKTLLQTAGCTDSSILAHCDNKIHTRGCWLVDWCLGIDD